MAAAHSENQKLFLKGFYSGRASWNKRPKKRAAKAPSPAPSAAPAASATPSIAPAVPREWIPFAWEGEAFPDYQVSTETGRVRKTTESGNRYNPRVTALGKIPLYRDGRLVRFASVAKIAAHFSPDAPLPAGAVVSSDAASGEKWLPVIGAARYEVSSLGRVRNAGTGYVMQPRETIDALLYVRLTVDDGGEQNQRPFFVHDVVCEAFNGPRPFPTAEARHHPDSNTYNNRSSNLVWGEPRRRLTLAHASWIREGLVSGFYTIPELAAALGVSPSAIHAQACKIADWPDYPAREKTSWRSWSKPPLPEEWRPIRNWPGWERSSYGNLRRDGVPFDAPEFKKISAGHMRLNEIA